jgi:hypothetical protein
VRICSQNEGKTPGAGAPTATGGDGVTARYKNPSNPDDAALTYNTASTVSIHIDVPFSATKGLVHQIGFPANDLYSNPVPNQFFNVVVYDAIPTVTSIGPTTVSATVPTLLTVTGSWFGDHPTVYVGGTAYTPSSLVHTYANGQDVTTVTVTLPASAANSNVSVYVVSNGSGGQAFYGAPISNASQRGSPQSNTRQLQVQPPIAISSFVPSTFQIGGADAPFTIYGSSFGSGIPSLDFGGSGVSVNVTGHDASTVSGTLHVPIWAVPGSVTVRLTAAGQTQSATTTITLTPGPPTISGIQGMWWFGANAAYGGTDLPGYYNSTLLAVTPGPGGVSPSASSPALWVVTPSSALQYASLDCVDAPCNSVILKLTAAPVGCAAIGVQVLLPGDIPLGGVSSSVFTVTADQPVSVNLVGVEDDLWNILPVYPGYESKNTMLVLSSCGQPVSNVSINEAFTGECHACSGDWNGTGVVQPSVGWAVPPAELGRWTTLPPGDPNQGTFPDTVGTAFPPDYPGVPRSVFPPGPPAQGTGPATARCTQVFYAGSLVTGQGFALVPDQQVNYTDHGRDQPWNWTCPLGQ